ncbi:MAG TPA: type II toxin-antitoxin system RelE/ParE family toxin [Desulfobulbus sp.]|nr:type II toxin-antitoxin system RelE/ParE family toxin [Desulfobulbus sp.]
MKLKWTGKALADLERLHDFLAVVNNPPAAARAVQSLIKTLTRLLENPRLGEQLFEFEEREVRRIIVGRYEIRYEIQDPCIYILRLWHTKEHR